MSEYAATPDFSQAQCRKVSYKKVDALFFARSKSKQKLAIEAFCDQCPIRLACLDFAVRMGSRGVAGGMTEAQRIKYKEQIELTSQVMTIEAAHSLWEQALKIQMVDL